MAQKEQLLYVKAKIHVRHLQRVWKRIKEVTTQHINHFHDENEN